MTQSEREELLRVMPQDNITEYMAEYGFTVEEVAAELDRRRKADEDFMAAETAKVKEAYAEKEAEIDPDVVALTNATIANLDDLRARSVLTVLEYLGVTYWTYCAALEHAPSTTL